MANERLRTALLQNGLTPAELAEHIDVDPKTVERWISGRIPYRRYRYTVASRLGVDEAYLWPGALADHQVTAASESEVLALYPHRWSVPHEVWGQLFDSAEDEIGILAYSSFFLADDNGMIDLLKTKAGEGVRIRLLLGDPDSDEVAARGRLEGIDDALAAKIRNVLVLYRRLTDLDGVDLHVHSTVLYNSIYRADTDLLVNSHIYGSHASNAPVMHLRQIAGGTMVTTYLESFERVWSESRPLDS